MSTDSDHTKDANGTNSTNTTLPGVVRGSLERLADDETTEAAILIRRLEVAQRFDDAEARALAETPEPLSGGPLCGAHRYLVTGDQSDDEWIASNYVVAVGFDGGDSQ